MTFQDDLREVLESICPACGGNGWYAGTGTETVRGEDGCPEPAPCEIQVQCDCNGIKADQITKLVEGLIGDKEIVKIILKWAKEQEAIDKFGEITLVEYEQGDITEIAKAITQQIRQRIGG